MVRGGMERQWAQCPLLSQQSHIPAIHSDPYERMHAHAHLLTSGRPASQKKPLDRRRVSGSEDEGTETEGAEVGGGEGPAGREEEEEEKEKGVHPKSSCHSRMGWKGAWA